MRKKITIITVAVVLAFLAVGATVALLIDVDRFRPQLAHAMSAAVGREVAIGHMSMSLFAGTAVVDDLKIADDAAFGGAPFLTAKSVRVGIAVLPLVLSKRLQIESLRLQQPRVTLKRSNTGVWNISTFGASSAAPAGGDSSSSSSPLGLDLSVDRLIVSNGQVVIETPKSGDRQHLYDKLSVDVRDFSSIARFPFTLSIDTPGGGAITLNGHAGPVSAAGLGSTPLDAALEASRVDIAKSGLLDPSAGLGGIVDQHLHVVSDGAKLTVSGTLRIGKLQLLPGASPAAQPVDVTYASDYDIAKHQGSVKQGDVKIGNAAARVVGRYVTRDASPVLLLTLSMRHAPMSDLQTLLPAVGATLPRGARFKSGFLDAGFTATGAIEKLVTTGQALMSDATISGYDLGSQMQAVASLAGAGKSGETVIQGLRSTLRIAPEGIRVDGLNCTVKSIGSIDGDGTVAPNGALDFKMRARFAGTTGMTGEAARIASLGHPENGVPFRVSGTTTAPVFVPDVGRAATDAIKDPNAAAKAGGFVRSLFGKKK